MKRTDPFHVPHLSKTVSLTLCCLLLSSCAVKRDAYDVPLVSLPEKFKNAPQLGEAPKDLGKAHSDSLPAASLPLNAFLSEWWRLLENPELNGLIDRVLANNHDMKIATLRMAQTRARLDVSGSGMLPEVSLPARFQVEAPENGIGTLQPGGKLKSQKTYQVGLRADWRPDIWGERAAQYESAELQLWRSTFQRDDVQRRIIADTASNYVEYLALNDRLRVAKETENVLSEMLAALEARLKGGDATITEMEQQRAAVQSVRATIPVLEHQREVVLNRMSTLAGVMPGELKLADKGLDSLNFPAVLPGVPSTLLLRRPDVRAVEARLLSADADIDVARARVLPPLDLTAQVGYGSHFISRLFQPHALFWDFVANLSISIFDNGKRANEVKFARAMHEEMVEDYVRVIYNAVREVDDSLSAIRLGGSRMSAQGEATDSSRRAWNYSQESYMAGAVDYLVLLDTERTFHRNLDEWFTARMERFRGLINLCSALGGGVPKGNPIPGDGTRPTTLMAKLDHGVVLTATAPVVGGKNDEYRFQTIGFNPASDRNNRSFAGKGGKDPLGVQKVDVVFTATPPSLPQPSEIDWSEKAFLEDQEQWMVELPGVYERSTVEAAWRDLRARFPEQTAKLSLLTRQEGRLESSRDTDRTSWYRLYVAKLADKRSADELSNTMREKHLRCWVVSSKALRTGGSGSSAGMFTSSGLFTD